MGANSIIKDKLTVIAFFRVYALDIYAVKYSHIENGKDNLRSYFEKKGWSWNRLRTTLSALKDDSILRMDGQIAGLYKLSPMPKNIICTLLSISES